MTNFFLRVKRQIDQDLPFVIYNKPDERQLRGIFQQNDHLYFSDDFSESGFVMAPFDGEVTVLIPFAESEVVTVAMHDRKREKLISRIKPVGEKGRQDFEALVSSGIEAIEKGHFQKVVLSRCEKVVADLDPIEVFEKMIDQYPTAMKYLWFHPKVGMWMGATPEKLLKATGKKFCTMALAGTQPYSAGEIIWEQKEKDEQQFVTDFILQNLKNSISEMTVSTPYTQQAGNLVHIKTDIEGVLNEDATLRQVVTILHPTPAVCGLPKLLAKEFILENEGYDREFYTGYLGELNTDGTLEDMQSDLFVNLRCMQIKHDHAILYVGCGITKESTPENEYFETVNKALTMKNLIQ